MQENLPYDVQPDLTPEQPSKEMIKALKTAIIINIKRDGFNAIKGISTQDVGELVTGNSVLDKKMVPIYDVQPIHIALKKFPFMQARIIIAPRTNLFVKASEIFFKMSKTPEYIQSNDIKAIELVENTSDAIFSNFDELYDYAVEILTDKYEFDCIELPRRATKIKNDYSRSRNNR